MKQRTVLLGTRALTLVALLACISATSGCRTLGALKDRLFVEKRTVVNPLLESPTWLPSLRIIRESRGMVDGYSKCRQPSGGGSLGTIDPNFDYWLIEWPEVIYYEKVIQNGRPREVETRGHEICLTKVTHAATTDLQGTPDEEFARLWEIEFESDTGRTGPRKITRYNARMMGICDWQDRKVALWRYDDRICMPNRRTVTEATREFMFRQRVGGGMVPVHAWNFVSVDEKHKADPRPGQLINIPSAGRQRQRQNK